jgi:hypothetical protein
MDSLETDKHKTTWNAIPSSLLAHFRAQREILSQTVTADETWTGDKKAIHGMVQPFIFPEEKIQRVSVSMQG